MANEYALPDGYEFMQSPVGAETAGQPALSGPDGYRMAAVPEAPLDVATGALRSFGAGGMLGFRDEAQAGVEVALDSILGSGTTTFDDSLNRIRGEDAQFAEEHPVIDFAGKMAGGIVPSLVTGGGALPAVVVKEAALGGIEGFGSSEDKFSTQGLMDAGVGATMSGAGAGVVGQLGRTSRTLPSGTPGERVLKTIGMKAEEAKIDALSRNTSRRTTSQIVDAAENRAGKRLLTKAQESGSISAMRADAGMENVPFLSATTNIKDNFANALNNEAMISIGLNPTLQGTNKLTVDVLEDAGYKIGKKFDRVFKGKEIRLDKKLISDLDAVDKDVLASLGTSGDKASNIIQDLTARINLATGAKEGIEELPIQGAELQKLRSELLNLSRDAMRGNDTNLSNSLSSTVGVIDSQISRGLPDKKTEDLWREANDQWKAYKALTGNDFVINSDTGDVGGKQLFRALSKTYGGSTKIPESPLSDLARMAKKPGVGDSGTGARQRVAQALIGTGAAGAANVTASLPELGAIIAGGRLLSEVNQRAPQAVTGLLAGSAARASAPDLDGTPQTKLN